MIILYLVRHGEVHEGRSRFIGHTDASLTRKGEAQTALYVKKLREVQVHAVYSSDLTRAKVGGELIADSHSLILKTDSALRERCWGEWDGLSAKEAENRDPAFWQLWCGDSFSRSPERAETPNQFFSRVTAAMKAVAMRHQRENVAVVCHSGVIRAVHAWLSGRWPEGFFDITPPYGSLHRFDLGSGLKMKQYLPLL